MHPGPKLVRGREAKAPTAVELAAQLAVELGVVLRLLERIINALERESDTTDAA